MSRVYIVLRITLTAVVMVVFIPTVRAVVLEDFPFSDPNGTLLENAQNVANSGNMWTTDPDLNNSAVLNGAFRIQHQGTFLESNYIDIANITTGKAWLVAEIAGWSLNSDTANPDNFDPANPEEIRFAFLNNDGTSGSTLSGQAQFQRTSTGEFELIGNTAGAGGTNISGAYPLTLSRSTPFTVVLEVDVTDTVEDYSVYYKDGSADFALLGTGNIAPGRDGNSVRFAVRRSWAGDGEFFDVSRIYLTNENPIQTPVDPIVLTLEVRSNGQISIINHTAGPVSFDAYRITSPSAALNFAGWNSFMDQGIDPVDGGNDPGETWEQAGGSDNGVLAESFLLGSSTMAQDGILSLGSAFQVGGAHDLTFQYHDTATGAVAIGEIEYITVAGVNGDYNGNGTVDAADYTVWRDALTSSETLPNDTTPGSVTLDDYTVWKNNFGSMAGAGSGVAAGSVPEPAAVALLAMAASYLIYAADRRRRPCGRTFPGGPATPQLLQQHRLRTSGRDRTRICDLLHVKQAL